MSKIVMRCIAADMAGLLLLTFVTLIAPAPRDSFASKAWNPEDLKGAPLGGDAESSLEEASGLFGRPERHRVVKRTHGALSLDAMIGYTPPSAAPDSAQETGSHQMLEAELDAGNHFSGFGALHSSALASTATTASSDIAKATAIPETGTGTDFGLLGVKDSTRNATGAHLDAAAGRSPWRAEEEEGEGEGSRATPNSDALPNGASAETGWDWMTTPPQEPHVVCVDWTQPRGHGYVILNMTHNLNCEEFRSEGGARLLRTMERRFARRVNSPEGSWVIYLSKPTHQQAQMLMHVASEHGAMSTKDLLNLLGEMRLSLNQVGIRDYGAPSACPPRRSPSRRSDYSKLFVVLVVIGSICLAIIASGFIYICWQRRPPAAKTTFHAEELRFVENACHDNPTLDVAGDNQPDNRPREHPREDRHKMEKAKGPSTNGLAGGGEAVCGGDDNPRWQVFVNQAAAEEEDEEEEEDTHL